MALHNGLKGNQYVITLAYRQVNTLAKAMMKAQEETRVEDMYSTSLACRPLNTPDQRALTADAMARRRR